MGGAPREGESTHARMHARTHARITKQGSGWKEGKERASCRIGRSWHASSPHGLTTRCVSMSLQHGTAHTAQSHAAPSEPLSNNSVPFEPPPPKNIVLPLPPKASSPWAWPDHRAGAWAGWSAWPPPPPSPAHSTPGTGACRAGGSIADEGTGLKPHAGRAGGVQPARGPGARHPAWRRPCVAPPALPPRALPSQPHHDRAAQGESKQTTMLLKQSTPDVHEQGIRKVICGGACERQVSVAALRAR